MRSKYGRLVLLTFLAVAVALSGTAHGRLLERGPVLGGPLNLFPAWYMDTNGVALEACLDGPPLCLSTLAELGNPAVGEAFYWSATANVASGAATGFVEYGLEMAFLNPVINRANAMIFNRLRTRITGLPAAGRYIMVHPYGRKVYTATPEPGLLTFEINDTADIPGVAGPTSFNAVLRAPNVGPWLRQINPPRGRLGTTAVATPVTGGPNGNTITITGPGGFTMTTSRFAVEGKLATNGGLIGVRANYSRTATGAGTVNAFASSIGGQNIVGRLGTAPNIVARRLLPIAGQLGDYSAVIPFTAAQSFEPLRVTNGTDAGRPTVTLANVPDVVTITRANFTAGTLNVIANSSDLFVPRPVLTLTDSAGTVLATRRGRINVSIPSPVNPGTIRVTSGAGGAATSTVRVGP